MANKKQCYFLETLSTKQIRIYVTEMNQQSNKMKEEGLATIDNRFCDESEFSLTPWAQIYGCSQQ